MILYINGNEHYSAAYAAVNAVHAEDDIDLWWMGRVGHPKNIDVSFGRVLSKVLKARLIVEARQYQDDNEIFEVTKKFVLDNPVKEQVVAVIALDQFDKQQVENLANFFKEHNVKYIIHPHSDYIKWMQDHAFQSNEFGYFGETAQKAWAANLIKPLTRIL